MRIAMMIEPEKDRNSGLDISIRRRQYTNRFLLHQKNHMELTYFVGFLDGINDSLKNPNPIEEMEADTVVSLDYDKEKLYYNMVAAKADWLYGLEQWDALLTSERRKELYKEQRSSTTVVKPPKIGRNDPCPCGSGKKYKKCCGRN